MAPLLYGKINVHEIERKFLLNVPLEEVLLKNLCVRELVIEQRYLRNCGDWTSRIRKTVCGDDITYRLTMKRKINTLRNIELETPIDGVFYENMASQCGAIIRKIRYEIEHMGHLWEVDSFLDSSLDGLTIVEIELGSETEFFHIPEWVGEEVTHNRNYRNSRIAKSLTTT